MKPKTRIAALIVLSWAHAVFAQQPSKATPPAEPPSMPYTAVVDPQFVPVTQAFFLIDEDIVIGVAQGNVAKAYPAADVSQHGVVHDEMADGPIIVSWCVTCNTSAVYRSDLKGRRLHFEWDSMVGANEVERDRETGSLWQQSTGEAISGPLRGSQLELYPFVRTTWKEWRRRFPGTLALKPLPGYAEVFAFRRGRITEGIPGGTSAPKGSFGQDDRLRAKEIVAGLAIGADAMAFPFSALRTARVVNERVGGTPVVVVHQSSSDTTTAFDPRVNGKVYRFTPANADSSSLMDEETHSTWDAYGHCVDGALKGTQLKPVILVPEFWFAWSEFHPKTRVFTVGQSSSKNTGK